MIRRRATAASDPYADCRRVCRAAIAVCSVGFIASCGVLFMTATLLAGS